MNLEIKELIEKIKKEAILEVEKKKQEILAEAKQSAQRTIQDAQLKAQEIIKEAESKANQIQENLKSNLKYLGRDFLLILKDQIQQLFLKIIQQEIKETLTSEGLKQILEKIILNVCSEKEAVVYLSEEEFNRLKDTFLKELKEKLKDQVNFKIDPELKLGFRISFDKEKSYFDFSQEALADYLFKRLQPQIQELLK